MHVVTATPVQEQMGLKRGHGSPAHRARLGNFVVPLSPLEDQQTLDGVVVLLDQTMQLLAGHRSISTRALERHK